MTGEPSNVLLVGLPHTGKTSFLALLYLALARGSSGEIAMPSFGEDREYLNRISSALESCEEATHTEVDEEGRLSLTIEVSGRRSKLNVPDLSGETWDSAQEDRLWTADLDSQIREASGILFFVHVGELVTDPTIRATQLAQTALGAVPGPATVDGSEPRRSTQVSAVDLLQLVCQQRARRPVRLSLVISAWDLSDGTVHPEDWIAENTPLLHQYLSNSSGWLEHRVWAVSAQGGDFSSEASRLEAAGSEALDRAAMLNASGQPCDVAAPLTWALRSSDG